MIEIICACHDNKVYLGTYMFDCDPGYETQYLKEELQKTGGWIQLRDVWELVTVRQHQVDKATGRIEAEHRMHLLMPIDMVAGPMKVFNVQVATWYDVGADPVSRERVNYLKKQAEDAAQEERAREAGIALPKSGMRPGGKNPGLRSAVSPTEKK
jgi:hypothetical protein